MSILIIRFGVAGKVDKKFKNLMDFGTPAAVIKQKKRSLSLSPLMAAAAPVKTGGSSPLKFYQLV